MVTNSNGSKLRKNSGTPPCDQMAPAPLPSLCPEPKDMRRFSLGLLALLVPGLGIWGFLKIGGYLLGSL